MAVWLGTSSLALGEDKWYRDLSLDEAKAQAKKEGKNLVFIDFYADWCQPCRMLDATTFKDPEVVAWLRKHTVALKVDGDRNTRLTDQFKVVSFPTLVFLRPDGTEIDRIITYLPPAEFLEAAAGIAEGKDAIARAKEKVAKGDATNPLVRKELAFAYATKGRYKDAFNEYVWCLEEGFAKHPELSAMRGMVASEMMMMLSGAYPSLLDELAARRAAVRKRVEDGSAAANDIMTLALYDDLFREPERTLALYEAKRTRPDTPAAVRAALAEAVLPMLLDARRYADIASDLDIMAAVDRIFAGVPAKESATEDERLMAVYVVPAYYQILVGLGRQDDAAKVAARLIAMADRPETYNTLAWNAYLSGKPTPTDLEYARKADRLAEGKDIGIIDTLARLLHALGQKDEAIQVAERGVKIAAGWQEQALIQETLADIKADRPARSP
jgi:thioredoxin-related protein